MLTSVISISVLALDGGAIIPSQIASPDNLLAATAPSMASTGVSLSSSNHSRNILSVSSIGEPDGPGPAAAAGPVPGDDGGGGGGGAPFPIPGAGAVAAAAACSRSIFA